MLLKDENIDKGKAFDWGRTSADYAKYRDIYPKEFYGKIVERGLCTAGQKVLDIGTGTGVLPRNLYSYGVDWTAAEISKEQIEQASRGIIPAQKSKQNQLAELFRLQKVHKDSVRNNFFR